MWYYCQAAPANFLYIALELCPAQRRMGPPAVLCAFQCLAIAMSRGAGSSARISTVLDLGCIVRCSMFEHHYVALGREGHGWVRSVCSTLAATLVQVQAVGAISRRRDASGLRGFAQPLSIHWDVLQNGVYCAQLSSLPPILRVLDELKDY
ncbi:hypothetical protein BJ912DRAFT_927729 [Pholiota molesta]|nr:hypothetical protein BJ912DRAFT_927729 [Pholiota molesta]